MLIENQDEYHLEALVLALYNERIKTEKSVSFPLNDYFPSVYDRQMAIRLNMSQARRRNQTPIEKVKTIRN